METTNITLRPGETTQWRPFDTLPDGGKVTVSTDSPTIVKTTTAADGTVTITSIGDSPAYGPASVTAHAGDQRAHATVAVVEEGGEPLWAQPAEETPASVEGEPE